MRHDIVRGATFPDYELPDQDGNPERLSGLPGVDPMVLVLTRGHLCPKDHRQYREIVALMQRIEVAYTKVVTISSDDPNGH